MPDTPRHWTRYFVRRVERWTTTWTLRLTVLVLACVVLWLFAPRIERTIGASLVCTPDAAPSDAIIIENFDPDYLLFERARILRSQGVAPRVLVPIRRDERDGGLNRVAQGIAEVMGQIARLGEMEFIPIREVEPISLNAARDVRAYLEANGIRSVTVVTPLFRSRRSTVVYRATLEPAGVVVRCEPVANQVSVETWTRTWHGMQNVTEQWLKLQYYRVRVLPFLTDGGKIVVAGRSR
ncbi:MAG: hypothetical protein IT182_14620 [Acidobacteria bacterium]|nr:hypothetical protein [Acidobacteriota bacterium]